MISLSAGSGHNSYNTYLVMYKFAFRLYPVNLQRLGLISGLGAFVLPSGQRADYGLDGGAQAFSRRLNCRLVLTETLWMGVQAFLITQLQLFWETCGKLVSGIINYRYLLYKQLRRSYRAHRMMVRNEKREP